MATGDPATGSGRVCVCPGSFDPVTNGHVDVVRRAAALFDEVVVAVLTNPAKAGIFSPRSEQTYRRDASRPSSASAGDLPDGVRVEAVDGGLLVDYCRRVGAVAVVKGLRSGTRLRLRAARWRS